MMKAIKKQIKNVIKFFIRGETRKMLRRKYDNFVDKGVAFYVSSYYLFNHLLICRSKHSTDGLIHKYYIGPFLAYKSKKYLIKD